MTTVNAGGNSQLTDDALLDAALEAFAEHGFAGTSVRQLARALGVSHNLIPQRFGSKERLWFAAVDRGFAQLRKHLYTVDEPEADDLSRLRAMVVGFIEANATRPALLRVVTREAATPGARLDYIVDHFIEPARQVGDALLQQFHRQGDLGPASGTMFYFFMTHGACGAATFPALAGRLGGPVDTGDPADVRRYAEAAADMLFHGLGGPPTPRN